MYYFAYLNSPIRQRLLFLFQIMFVDKQKMGLNKFVNFMSAQH